jgi:hypothetical protein
MRFSAGKDSGRPIMVDTTNSRNFMSVRIRKQAVTVVHLQSQPKCQANEADKALLGMHLFRSCITVIPLITDQIGHLLTNM